MKNVRCILIDNYDSFTFNLVHLLRELGAQVTIKKNDEIKFSEIKQYDKIILSPGPGVPSEAGKLLDIIKQFAPKKPILGVCLGHQAIAEAFGGKLENLSYVFHGVETKININPETQLFKGLKSNIIVGRYHSWVVSKDNFPSDLEITAQTKSGLIMALQHKNYEVHSIQFHPESVLTPDGKTIVKNWLEI